MNDGSWVIFPDNPGLSAAVLLAAAMVFLYAARGPMHELVRSLGQAFSRPLRLAARSLLASAKEIDGRNKALLLGHARRELESRIEWDFERVSVLVKRDLSRYPELQRRLLDEIARLEEDYRQCGEVPPPPPDWVEALAAVAGVKSAGGEMVQGVLEQIRGSMGRIHDKAISEYRRSCKKRHQLLGGLLPFWRSVENAMTHIDTKLAALHSCAASIDAHMEKYREIRAGGDRATQALTLSAFKELVVAGLVLVVATGGIFVNLKLIAPAMSRFVGTGDYLAGLPAFEVAALALTGLAAAMGLLTLETLRITHLFAPLARLGERMRQRMLCFALAMLLGMALGQAALVLVHEEQGALQSLAAVPQAALVEGWVASLPAAGQLLLAFLLPLALAFIAIPLESLVYSVRAVGGVLLLAAARVAALALRLAGQLATQSSRVVIGVYDVLIVLPLLVERIAKSSAFPATVAPNHPRRHRKAYDAAQGGETWN